MTTWHGKARRRSAPRVSARIADPGAGGPSGGGPAFAALDLGTNNCRLLVATPEGDSFRVVDAFSRIVRLGEGLERRGRLGRRAMERTVGALKVCASKMARKRVLMARNVATEACRRAANCGEFLDMVLGETGLEIEIITTEEEARLALAGCAPLLLDGFDHALVFDIGGGSTEIMWVETPRDRPGERLRVIEILSVPVGVVNLAERRRHDRMTPSDFGALVALFAEQMGRFGAGRAIDELIAGGHVQMLGTSGTVTTLAGIHLGLPAYDRGLVDGSHLTFDEIGRVTRRLLSLDLAGRAREPCVGEARADLVLAGCAILEAICRAWPVGRLRVADRGVREGILCGLMGLDSEREGAGA